MIDNAYIAFVWGIEANELRLSRYFKARGKLGKYRELKKSLQIF